MTSQRLNVTFQCIIFQHHNMALLHGEQTRGEKDFSNFSGILVTNWGYIIVGNPQWSENVLHNVGPLSFPRRDCVSADKQRKTVRPVRLGRC